MLNAYQGKEIMFFRINATKYWNYMYSTQTKTKTSQVNQK